MKKLITLIILLSSAVAMFAVDFTYNGINYTILSEEDKTCEVRAGAFPVAGTEIEGDVVIPEVAEYQGVQYTVVRIGKCAFYRKNVSSVEIPNTVTSIGEAAFEKTGLRSVVIPNSVKEIEQMAFYACYPLSSIELSNTLTTIGFGVFGDCANLYNIVIPNSVTSIGEGVFSRCNWLSSVILSNSLTSIEDGTFGGCTNLKSLTIPNSVKSIGNNAFASSGLTSITIPGSVDSIGIEPFRNCSELKEIIVDESNTTFSSNNGILYNKDLTTLICCPIGVMGTLDIPESVKTIHEFAFKGCYGLFSIQLPSSVTEIQKYAFEGCNALTSIDIPSSVNNIGNGAFKNCRGIKSIIIPKVPEIYRELFEGCINLTSAELPDGITAICEFAFKGCEKLTSIKIPDSADYIGPEAFYGCTGLTSVFMTNSLVALSWGAFANCSALTSITIPPTTTEIAERAFEGCSSLSSLDIPESVNDIGLNAFKGCSSLTSVTIPNKLKKICDGTFEGCGGLTNVYIPNSVTEIGINAFKDCSGLTSIEFSNTLTTIGDNAFSGCTNMNQIIFQSPDLTIGAEAFILCPNLKTIFCMGANPPHTESYEKTFSNEAYESSKLIVTCLALPKIKAVEPWNCFKNIESIEQSLVLSHSEITIGSDEAFQLGLYGAEGKIEWSTSDASVAYANECGLVVAMGVAGTAEITAKANGEQVSCNVTVTAQSQMPAKALAEGETTDNQPLDIIIESVGGNPPMVNARLIPVGSSTVIDWTSSDESIASVERGLVTMHGTGEVKFGTETQNGLSESRTINLEDIATGITDITVDGDAHGSGNVYDLTGRCVLINATPEQISRLGKGIYIVNGKKVLVK